jgi:hypothetical protein
MKIFYYRPRCFEMLKGMCYSVLIFISYSAPCSRSPSGSDVKEPGQYYSALGSLHIRLIYKGGVGSDGNTQYCYITQDGVQSPTLMVWPGDRLRLTLTNLVEVPQYATADAAFINANYGTNLHFHGMFVSPAPGQDFAVTLVAPGQSFTYELDIPSYHPTGLFWYHPHFHGLVDNAMLGGASGLIIVQGLEQVTMEHACLHINRLGIHSLSKPHQSVKLARCQDMPSGHRMARRIFFTAAVPACSCLFPPFP